MKLLTHALVLGVSFGLVALWEQTGLDVYTIQAVSALVVAYLVITFIRRKKYKNDNFGGVSDIFILNTAIFLLIYTTGNIYSPLYFLLYFLGFGITFIFEPATVFLFTIGAVLVFLPEALKNGAIESYIKLGSLLLISPLAFFFGQEYRDRDKQEEALEEIAEREKDAGTEIAKDVEEVIKTEKARLDPEAVEKLNEILEESEDLRRESSE
jgi:hypothetical protein